MIRAIGYLLSEAIWAVVHRVFDRYATWPDQAPDDTTPETVAKWIGKHSHPTDPPR